MLQYTETDQLFYRWLNLSTVAPEYKKHLDIDYDGDRIIVFCKDLSIAKDVLDASAILTRNPQLIKLEIWIGETRYFPCENSKMEVETDWSNTSMVITLDKMRSHWALQNQAMLPNIDGILFLYSTDRDQGFRHLAIVPDKFGEKRLNKSSVQATLDLPLLDLEDSIAQPRLNCIEQVLATGEPHEYAYEHLWVQGESKTRWRFTARGQKVSDDEILIVVKDHPTYACWQKGYWENLEN